MKSSARVVKGLSPSYSLAKEKLASSSSRKAVDLFPIKPPRRIQVEEVQTSSISKRTVQASRLEAGLKKLEKQTQKINRLSKQMEEAIWELKAIATQVNQDSRSLPTQQRRSNVCEYREVRVPVIRQKSSGRLVLMSRSVDLCADRNVQRTKTLTRR